MKMVRGLSFIWSGCGDGLIEELDDEDDEDEDSLLVNLEDDVLWIPSDGWLDVEGGDRGRFDPCSAVGESVRSIGLPSL